MKVKGFKKLLMTAAVLFAFMLVPGFGANAEESSVKIPISVVEDISVSAVSRGSSSNVYETVYEFTIDKQAIVKVSAAQSFYAYASSAGVGVCISRDALGTAVVVDGNIGAVYAEGKEALTWLEPGTYYIVFKVSNPDYFKSDAGTTSVGICAEYISKTSEGNTSFKKAGSAGLNKEIDGFFSDTFRKQYYKFTLKSKSSVTIRMTADKKDGAGKNGKYYGILCNSEYEEIVNKEMSKDGTSESITKTLNKGTYYVVMDASDSSWYYGKTELKVTAKAVPADPKVTSVKKNTAAVKGTAVKGATVYASYNGKTYSAKVNSKGSFTIKTAKLVKGKSVKVYAKLNGLKSGTKTYKIK